MQKMAIFGSKNSFLGSLYKNLSIEPKYIYIVYIKNTSRVKYHFLANLNILLLLLLFILLSILLITFFKL